MNATERKRRWRASNPERSAAYERDRAHARRFGYWPGTFELGKPGSAKVCASADSYAAYERRWYLERYLSRMNRQTGAKVDELAEFGLGAPDFDASLATMAGQRARTGRTLASAKAIEESDRAFDARERGGHRGERGRA
jgi:hypothetical protein